MDEHCLRQSNAAFSPKRHDRLLHGKYPRRHTVIIGNEIEVSNSPSSETINRFVGDLFLGAGTNLDGLYTRPPDQWSLAFKIS